MFEFEEYKAILDEGKQLMEETHHPTLAIELKILNKEFQKLQKSQGIGRELAKTTCDYYANEVRNSIQLATT